jgi:hypothetical protein
MTVPPEGAADLKGLRRVDDFFEHFRPIDRLVGGEREAAGVAGLSDWIEVQRFR